jgi:hypothetical protein
VADETVGQMARRMSGAPEYSAQAMTEEAINEGSYLVEDETAEAVRIREEKAQDDAYQVEDDEAQGAPDAVLDEASALG